MAYIGDKKILATVLVDEKEVHVDVGMFDETVTYTKQALVYFNGKLYTPIVESVSGVLPTDTTKWLELTNSKLDKVTTAGSRRVYAIKNNGEQETLNLTYNNITNGVPIYHTSQGSTNVVIKTGTPFKDLDCANKEYVDAQKVYCHHFSIESDGGMLFNAEFEVLSTKSTPLTWEDLRGRRIMSVNDYCTCSLNFNPYENSCTIYYNTYTTDGMSVFHINDTEWPYIFDTVLGAI